MVIHGLDLAASGWVAPSSGIQGITDFEGSAGSDGQQAKAKGTLKVQKLKLVANGAPSKVPVTIRYAIDHGIQADTGTLSQVEVAVGKATARLSGSYQGQGPATSLKLRLNAESMPVDEIADALPAVGVVLPSGSKLQGGMMAADLTITGPTANPVVTGPVRLSNAKLAGFDLGSKLSAIPAFSGRQTGGKDTTIQNFSTTVRMAPEGTQANSISLTIPSFATVTGGGTIGASGALNFDMLADLNGGSGGGVIQKAGQGGGIPFGIEGTTSDPKFVPNVKAMAGTAARQAISEKAGIERPDARTGRRRR